MPTNAQGIRDMATVVQMFVDDLRAIADGLERGTPDEEAAKRIVHSADSTRAALETLVEDDWDEEEG